MLHTYIVYNDNICDYSSHTESIYKQTHSLTSVKDTGKYKYIWCVHTFKNKQETLDSKEAAQCLSSMCLCFLNLVTEI